MSKRTNLCIALASLACFTTAAARAEKLEDVEKKLSEQSKKITSMSMKMKSVSDVSAEGFKTKSTLDGTYEYLIDGKKTLSRTDAVTKTHTEAGPVKQDMDAKSLSVNDGEFMWVLSEQSGQKSVSKLKADEKQSANWRDDMKEWYNVKLLPDETIEGKPCYVLEMTPKKAVPGDTNYRSVQYYQKDNCVLVKAVVFDAAGKPVSTTTYSDIKINPSLDKSRFKFTPPPGVEVMDMTSVTGLNPADGGKK